MSLWAFVSRPWRGQVANDALARRQALELEDRHSAYIPLDLLMLAARAHVTVCNGTDRNGDIIVMIEVPHIG